MERHTRNTLVILLAVCFLVSLAATTATAKSIGPKNCQQQYDKGFKDGYQDGFKYGVHDCHQKMFANHMKHTKIDCYDKGYAAGYPKGYKAGLKLCK